MTPAERSLRGRLGAYCLHAKYSAKETTARARSVFMSRFEELVDSNRTLPPAERARRAEAARSAYFARLSLKSIQARKKKKRKSRR